jgi:hypothetical protein
MDVAANSYKNKIIGKSSAQFWKEQILELGGDYMIWSNAPENPYLNRYALLRSIFPITLSLRQHQILFSCILLWAVFP